MADGGSDDEGTLLIVTDDASTCRVWDAASGGTEVTSPPMGAISGGSGRYERELDLTLVTYTSGDVWRVECSCSGCGSAATEYFRIVDESVPEVWLYSETPTAGLTPAESFLYDLAVAFDAGARPDPAKFNADPTMWSSVQDPRRSAWHDVMGATVPEMDIGPASAWTGCGTPSCGLPAYGATPTYGPVSWTPLGELATGRRGAERLLAVSMAALLAQICYAQGLCAGDTTVDLRDDYTETASYWGRTIVGDEDWNLDSADPDYGWIDDALINPNDDLCWARNLRVAAIAYEWMHPFIGQEARHEWLAGLVEKTAAFYAEDEFNLSSSDPGVYGNHYTQENASGNLNYAKRLLRNGHLWETNAALAITTMVLEESFPDFTITGHPRDEWDAWDRDSNVAMEDVFAELGTDGVDLNGIHYGEEGLESLLAYLEARRTLRSQDPNELWVDNTAMFLSHMTRPDGQRVPFAEGRVNDTNGPSHQMSLVSRYADAYGTSGGGLAERLAWLGHNEWSVAATSFSGLGQREVRDLLFYAPPASVPGSVAPYRNRCFSDTGYVTLSSEDDGGVHLVFRGGPIIGGHEDPDVGSLAMYFEGDLVTLDGDEQTAKRTAAASTLLVDGRGQHFDGYDVVDAVPENASENNNSFLSVYLDNSGAAWDGQAFDLVLAASDMTQLYRLDDADGLRGSGEGFTDVDGSGASGTTLDELERYVLWLGDRDPYADPSAGAGAVFLYDRYQSTGANWEYT